MLERRSLCGNIRPTPGDLYDPRDGSCLPNFHLSTTHNPNLQHIEQDLVKYDIQLVRDVKRVGGRKGQWVHKSVLVMLAVTEYSESLPHSRKTTDPFVIDSVFYREAVAADIVLWHDINQRDLEVIKATLRKCLPDPSYLSGVMLQQLVKLICEVVILQHGQEYHYTNIRMAFYEMSKIINQVCSPHNLNARSVLVHIPRDPPYVILDRNKYLAYLYEKEQKRKNNEQFSTHTGSLSRKEHDGQWYEKRHPTARITNSVPNRFSTVGMGEHSNRSGSHSSNHSRNSHRSTYERNDEWYDDKYYSDDHFKNDEHFKYQIRTEENFDDHFRSDQHFRDQFQNDCMNTNDDNHRDPSGMRNINKFRRLPMEVSIQTINGKKVVIYHDTGETINYEDYLKQEGLEQTSSVDNSKTKDDNLRRNFSKSTSNLNGSGLNDPIITSSDVFSENLNYSARDRSKSFSDLRETDKIDRYPALLIAPGRKLVRKINPLEESFDKWRKLAPQYWGTESLDRQGRGSFNTSNKQQPVTHIEPATKNPMPRTRTRKNSGESTMSNFSEISLASQLKQGDIENNFNQLYRSVLEKNLSGPNEEPNVMDSWSSVQESDSSQTPRGSPEAIGADTLDRDFVFRAYSAKVVDM